MSEMTLPLAARSPRAPGRTRTTVAGRKHRVRVSNQEQFAIALALFTTGLIGFVGAGLYFLAQEGWILL
ncbi:hypothetical protein HMPREF0880_02461 [Yokenella regensburgei ATCC 43003]|nr:hypothetical protein HMPREF0880_02461 [Yokenella regensburgei ATCC 43003]